MSIQLSLPGTLRPGPLCEDLWISLNLQKAIACLLVGHLLGTKLRPGSRRGKCEKTRIPRPASKHTKREEVYNWTQKKRPQKSSKAGICQSTVPKHSLIFP